MKTSQPLAGGGLSTGQSGGGPYLRCPFSCTSGYPVRVRSSSTAVSFASATLVVLDDDDCGHVRSVVAVDSTLSVAMVKSWYIDRKRAIWSVFSRPVSWTWVKHRAAFTYRILYHQWTGDTTQWGLVAIAVTWRCGVGGQVKKSTAFNQSRPSSSSSGLHSGSIFQRLESGEAEPVEWRDRKWNVIRNTIASSPLEFPLGASLSS